jgi:hypothetical protein
VQLKMKRDQRKGGLFKNKTIYSLDVRAEYSPEEKDFINSRKLGGELLFVSKTAAAHADRATEHLDSGNLARGIGSILLTRLNVSITIASLQRGHHIESEDLGEIAEAEQSITDACKNLKGYLGHAQTHDGTETVVEL